jgi:hypothetical protein
MNLIIESKMRVREKSLKIFQNFQTFGFSGTLWGIYIEGHREPGP